jgi:hypothetical protein
MCADVGWLEVAVDSVDTENLVDSVDTENLVGSETASRQK